MDDIVSLFESLTEARIGFASDNTNAAIDALCRARCFVREIARKFYAQEKFALLLRLISEAIAQSQDERGESALYAYMAFCEAKRQIKHICRLPRL